MPRPFANLPRLHVNVRNKAYATGLPESQKAPLQVMRGALSLSDEQTAVVDAGNTSSVIIVNAFAGTGKTTTAQGFASARPTERFLYLCLGRANAEEARQRFGRNVTVKTTHALALQYMGPRLGNGSRIEGRDRPWRPKSIMEELNVRSFRDAAILQKALAAYFASEDLEVGAHHVAAADGDFKLDSNEISRGLSNAQMAWARMNNPSERTTIPHDAYLKMFALEGPTLPYDWIIYDEAQDANPVTASIIRAQVDRGTTKVLCIGDRHQSIFFFRGAIDSMSEFALMPGARLIKLTKTWRFGEEIASAASTVLNELKDEPDQIIGMGTAGSWTPNKYTLLSRTNAQLFDEAARRNGRGIHWVGGVENYRVTLLGDAHSLYAGNKTAINDYFMRSFHNWDQFAMYGQNSRDPEASTLAKLVEMYKSKTPSIVENILRESVSDPAQAEITMTTAHKAKGLDWDCVRLADDFSVLVEAEKALVDDPGNPLPQKIAQEVNLLIVGMTRAKKAMELNVETRAWFAKLPHYQGERNKAKAALMKLHHEVRGA